MKRGFWFIITLFAAVGLISCTAYTFESGNYVMSIQLPKKTEKMPKDVSITLNGDRITIVKSGNKKTLTGTRKGNEFRFFSQSNSEKVEFTGQLTGNNTIEGNVIQTSHGQTTLSAKFTILKAGK